MVKLTPAQEWALIGIDRGNGASPATLGQWMMDRPGVKEKRRGGNRDSRQGLGRIGGTMMARLEKLGLIHCRSRSLSGSWCPTQAHLTTAGRAAIPAEARENVESGAS